VAQQEDETETPKQQKSPPRKGKETIPSSLIELKIHNKHLSVPKFMETERRPPGKTDTFESNSQSQSHSYHYHSPLFRELNYCYFAVPCQPFLHQNEMS
jgi:hypothetical protein